MLVPLDYSLWNSIKGGSDTVTRFACNCQIIVPIRSPQTVVVARFLALHAVLFHRLTQAVTMSKKSADIDLDTIKHIRDRNNKHWPFYKSLGDTSNRLLKMSRTRSLQHGEDNNGNIRDSGYLRHQAVRFTEANKDTQYDIDHSIMGAVSTTTATPPGRGSRKDIKNPGHAHEAYKKQCVECVVAHQ